MKYLFSFLIFINAIEARADFPGPNGVISARITQFYEVKSADGTSVGHVMKDNLEAFKKNDPQKIFNYQEFTADIKLITFMTPVDFEMALEKYR